MVSMNELKQDMITGMGYIGLDSGRLYRMRRGPKLIEAVASGTTIIINDATEGRPFRGLRVFGKSTQDGAPTPEAPVPIVSAGESGNITVEVRGKNLLQLQDGRGGNRGVEVTCRNGEISLVGTATETGWAILKVNPPVVLNGDYALSTSNDVECYLINNDYKIVIATPKPQNIVNGEVVKIAFGVTEGKIYNMNGIKVMLNRGLTASPYEPPRIPQSLTLQTPNGLPGIPVTKDGNYTDSDGQQWVCDEIDLERGKYVQRVVIENISGGWELKPSSDISGRFLQSRLTNTFQTAVKTAVCNIANFVSWGAPTNDIYAFALNKKVIYFSPPKGAEITAEELNAKLNSLSFPVVVVGELATPIERDLTPEELAAYSSLHAYYPTTVITNDAEAHMEATYVADTGKYIQNLEERLNAKLVNIQSALISQKISGGGIKVTDSSRVPVVRFAMWGKTEQRKTTGKNLIDIKGEITFSKGTFDIKDNLIDCTLADTWGGSYIMFSKEYPAGEYTFSADKMKNDTVQKIAILLTVEPLSNSADACAFNNYYKNYLIKNNKTLSRDITFKVDSPFEIGIPLSGDNDAVGETLSIKNIQLERGASATAYEPYSGGFPSPSPDWEQPIEITDQPVTITVKGGTEQQSITLIPPRPFTKWDKLEKVDGVCCWVYQSNHILSYNAESITTEYFSTTGELSAGAEVYYKADVPENIPLPRSEQDKLNALTMYAGTTEVTNTGGCNMELTYTVDTKSYVDSKIAAISAAVLEV